MRTSPIRGTGALVKTAAGLAALATVTAACGSSSKSAGSGATATTSGGGSVQCASGSISGAGSTFVQNLVQQWIKDYQATCSGATVNYQGVGSGAGRQQFLAGTVDFAGSDFVMPASEQQQAQAKGGAVTQIPWAAGGIALEYKLSGVKNLQLSPDTIAGIFAGKITKWDDAAVKSDNPGTSLPSKGITVVHRSDGSGTTFALTSYLTAASPSGWTYGADQSWKSPAGQGAKGSDQVTATVKQTDGAIGYAEMSFAKANSLDVAAVKNAGGKYVMPSTDSVKAALAAATVPSDGQIKLNYTATDPAAYPISTTTWIIVYTKQTDAAKGKLVQAFVNYAIGKGQSSAEGLYYTPLPDNVVTADQAQVQALQLS